MDAGMRVFDLALVGFFIAVAAFIAVSMVNTEVANYPPPTNVTGYQLVTAAADIASGVSMALVMVLVAVVIIIGVVIMVEYALRIGRT